MPAYDQPLSIWPGIITLTVGFLILAYLITRITRDYRRARAQTDGAQVGLTDSKDTANEPAP